ncbi:hypothetical protein ONZ45_g9008 [Pleurotus djamor]|nr:hypothetical protein ONZ45_g9008 [Pleurotus djamor]
MTATEHTLQSSAAQRALQIPELLKLIFEYHPESIQEKGRVCRAWADVAEEILWSDIADGNAKDFHDLLSLLGTIEIESKDVGFTYDFHSPEESDLDRLLKRTRRVRSLNLGEGEKYLDSQVVLTLLGSPGLMFPNLLSLSCPTGYRGPISIRLFAPPRLTSLTLDGTGDVQAFTNAIPAISQLLPELTQLKLEFAQADLSPRLESDFVALFTGLRALRSLMIASHLCSPPVLSAMSKLPCLHTLDAFGCSVDPSGDLPVPTQKVDGFAQLTKLLTEDFAVYRSLSWSESSLKELYISPRSVDQWRDISRTIVAESPGLESFSLTLRGNADETVAKTDLESLSQLPLKRLVLDFGKVTTHIAEGDLIGLLRHFPMLEEFSLKSALMMKASVLWEMAKVLPNLRVLRITLDFGAGVVESVAAGASAFQRLNLFGMAESPVSQASDVAAFLCKVLPNRCVIEPSQYGSSWKQVVRERKKMLKL